MFVTLFVDHVDILQCLANHSCKVSNGSLLQEIDAYFNKNINELQQKIAIINGMRVINVTMLLLRHCSINKLNDDTIEEDENATDQQSRSQIKDKEDQTLLAISRNAQ